MTDECRRCPRRDFKADILQYINLTVVAECNVFKLYPAFCNFMLVFCLLHRFMATVIKQGKYSACCNERLLENIQVLADLVYRFKKTLHILNKGKDNSCSNTCFKT